MKGARIPAIFVKIPVFIVKKMGGKEKTFFLLVKNAGRATYSCTVQIFRTKLQLDFDGLANCVINFPIGCH